MIAFIFILNMECVSTGLCGDW